MKNIKYILALLVLLIGFGCTNYQNKKTDNISYKTIDGDRIKITVYEDGSQTVENLSLNQNNRDSQKEAEEKNNPNRE